MRLWTSLPLFHAGSGSGGAFRGGEFLVFSGDSEVADELVGLRVRSLFGLLLVVLPPAGPSPSQSLENSLPNFFHSGSRSGEGCVVGGGGGSRRVLLIVGLCCCCACRFSSRGRCAVQPGLKCRLCCWSRRCFW